MIETPQIPDSAPAALVEARDAHDAAIVAFEDFKDANADILASDYRARAERRDVERHKQYALEGKDSSKIKSEVERAEHDRPRILGQRAALEQRVKETRAALVDACTDIDNAHVMRRQAADEMAHTRDEMISAHKAYEAAMHQFGDAVRARLGWEYQSTGDSHVIHGSGVPNTVGNVKIHEGGDMPRPEKLANAVVNGFRKMGVSDPYEVPRDSQVDPHRVKILTSNGTQLDVAPDQAVYWAASGQGEFMSDRDARRFAERVRVRQDALGSPRVTAPRTSGRKAKGF